MSDTRGRPSWCATTPPPSATSSPAGCAATATHVLEAETGGQALEIAAERRRRPGRPRRAPAGHERPRRLRRHQGRPAHGVHAGAAHLRDRRRARGPQRRARPAAPTPTWSTRSSRSEMLSTVRSLLRSSVARRDAERLAVRLDRLSSASLRINVALNPARVATAAAEGLARMLDTESVVLLVEDATGGVVGRTTVDDVTTGATRLGRARRRRCWTRSATGPSSHAADEPWTSICSPAATTAPGPSYPSPGVGRRHGLVAVPAHAEATDEDRMLLRRLAADRGGRAGQPAGVRRGAPHRAHAAAQPAAGQPAAAARPAGGRALQGLRRPGRGRRRLLRRLPHRRRPQRRRDRRRAGPLAGGGHRDGRAALLAARVHARRARRARRPEPAQPDPAAQPPRHDRHRVRAGLPRRTRRRSRSRTPGTSRRWSCEHGTATYLEPTGTLLGVEKRRGRPSSIDRSARPAAGADDRRPGRAPHRADRHRPGPARRRGRDERRCPPRPCATT